MATSRNVTSMGEPMLLKLEELSKGWPGVLNSPVHPNHKLAKTLRSHYSCDGCSKLGKDWSFHCAACDFDLHPNCALEAELAQMAKSWPRRVQHKLHREHPLLKTRCELYFCDACAETGNWWSFCCRECNFDLHPDCALPTRDGNAELPERVVHEFVRTASRGSYWCGRCAEEGSGWSYRCEDCNVDIHPKCVQVEGKKGAWPERAAHELHMDHVLTKKNLSCYWCDKCWMEGQGWSFCCKECDFHLHPKCAVELPGKDRSGDGGWPEKVMHEQKKQQFMQQKQQQQKQMGPVGDAAENQIQLLSTMARLERMRVESELSTKISSAGYRAALDLFEDGPVHYERRFF